MCTHLGDLEILYIAKNDSDALVCATLGENVASYINNIARGSSRQRRQAPQANPIDPIFNFMTIASPLEQEMSNSTDSGDGTGDDGASQTSSGVRIISAPHTLIFALVLLLKLLMY